MSTRLLPRYLLFIVGLMGVVICLSVAYAVRVKGHLDDLERSVNESVRVLRSDDQKLIQLYSRVDLVLGQTYKVERDLRLLSKFSWVPVVGDSIRGLEQATSGSILVAGVLKRVLEIPLMDDRANLHISGTILEIMSELSDSKRDLLKGADQIEAGVGRLDYIEDDQRDEIIRLVRNLRLGIEIVDVLPEILGVNGSRKYLVLGQTSDELRPSGGYVSTAWVLTFEDAALVDVTYKDIVEVDDWDNLNLYPVADEALRDHMQTCCLLLRDVSWEPDFPSVARMALQIYYLGQGESLDGVIGINQMTLQKISEFLGPLTFSDYDGEVAPSDFQKFLQEQTDLYGRGYTEGVLDVMLDKAEESLLAGRAYEAMIATRNALETKLLLFYSNNDEVQRILNIWGATGKVPSSPFEDYLGIFDSNVGWSKVDRNIRRESAYNIVLGATSASKATLTLSYTNMSGEGASGCEYQWMPIVRGNTNLELMHACYWNYLRVYIPHGARLVKWAPMLLPEGSIFATKGAGISAEDTKRVFSRYGKTGIGGLIVVPPGSTYVQEFLYELPSDVIQPPKDDSSGYTYNLNIASQPGVDVRYQTIQITAPTGMEFVNLSPLPLYQFGKSATWVVEQSSDITIEVEFE